MIRRRDAARAAGAACKHDGPSRYAAQRYLWFCLGKVARRCGDVASVRAMPSAAEKDSSLVDVLSAGRTSENREEALWRGS